MGGVRHAWCERSENLGYLVISSPARTRPARAAGRARGAGARPRGACTIRTPSVTAYQQQRERCMNKMQKKRAYSSSKNCYRPRRNIKIIQKGLKKVQ